METTKKSISVPSKMSEYISNYFKSEFLTDISTVKNQKGELVYLADISHDNTLYHLKFDEHGNLLHKNSEELQELLDEAGDFADPEG